jgi:hypothetical protein
MIGLMALRANCGIPLQHPLACVNQPKVLVTSEYHHTAIITSICVTRMARRLEVDKGKYKSVYLKIQKLR